MSKASEDLPEPDKPQPVIVWGPLDDLDVPEIASYFEQELLPLGGLMMVVGFILLIIPGLALLATEYVWAQRLLRLAQEKANQAKNSLLGKKEQAPPTSISGMSGVRSYCMMPSATCITTRA